MSKISVDRGALLRGSSALAIVLAFAALGLWVVFGGQPS